MSCIEMLIFVFVLKEFIDFHVEIKMNHLIILLFALLCFQANVFLRSYFKVEIVSVDMLCSFKSLVIASLCCFLLNLFDDEFKGNFFQWTLFFVIGICSLWIKKAIEKEEIMEIDLISKKSGESLLSM